MWFSVGRGGFLNLVNKMVGSGPANEFNPTLLRYQIVTRLIAGGY